MGRDTTQTENRSYDRPSIGSDWAASWDELVEDLDVAVHLEGTFANRPASPPAGTKYWATDYKIFSRYDGSTWHDIWGVGTDANRIPAQYVDQQYETLRETKHRQVPVDYSKREDYFTREHTRWSAQEINNNWSFYGTATLDSTTQYRGNDSLQIEGGGGGVLQARSPSGLGLDLSDKWLSVAFYVDSATDSAVAHDFHIWLEDASGNRVEIRDMTYDDEMYDRWIRADMGMWSDNTSFDWTNVSMIAIRKDPGSNNATMNWADVKVTDQPSRGTVIFTFDDGAVEDYENAYPKLGEYGFAGSFFVPTDRLDTAWSGYSDPRGDFYQEMEDWGHDVCPHMRTGDTQLTDMTTTAEKEDAIIGAKRELLRYGFDRGADFFKPMAYRYDAESLDLIEDHYEMNLIGNNDFTTGALITDPLTTGVVSGLGVSDVSGHQAAIDLAAEYNTTAIFTIHSVNIPGNETAFDDILSYAQSEEEAGNIRVMNLSQYRDWLEGRY